MIHTVCNEGGGGRGHQTDKHLPPSTFTGQFIIKADIGFGVFIDIWPMPKGKFEHFHVCESDVVKDLIRTDTTETIFPEPTL